MELFCKAYKFRTLVKGDTYFEIIENTSCINLILTEKNLNFQRPYEIEARLFEFHKMVLIVMKWSFLKGSHV